MAAKLKNIEKVANILGGTIDSFSDNSASWVLLKNQNHTICICFDGKGDKFTHITVGENVWQIVDEKVIARIESK